MTTTAPSTGTGAIIRKAREDDLPAIHCIEQTSFPQPWPYSAFETYLDDPGFLVAEGAASDDVIGYVVADAIPNHGTPLGHIKDIAVDADHRGTGIGSALLRRGLALLADTGAATAKLEVRESNEDAIRLYRRFGFDHRRRIRGYYGNGDDALVMVCRLADLEWTSDDE